MTEMSIDLEQLRRDNPNFAPREPFQPQASAFEALSKVFTFPVDGFKGGLLVLPTGSGKTFTAVNWVCRNVLPKKMKVLWLAQSSYLLNQASKAFCENALAIPYGRKSLNLRVVSSSPSHSKPATIRPTDDVLIITTQTAIKNFNATPEDLSGNSVETRFKEFIKDNINDGLFVVLDEAHHAPAYGCRNLLSEMRDLIPNLYLLGLTATPTYSDKRTRGWLFKIFDQKIIYEAKKASLIAQDILAKPKYIEKPTGRDFEIDDKLYDRLVREHKDLPENVIERLAKDSPRNDFIIDDYINNKTIYGKTLIFSDRWFQCEYIKTKLIEKGIRAEAVYSMVEANPGSAELRNKRTTTDNERIIKEFSEGKYDVLINVRMLTEGVDVPDIKTVMLTRQTTSSILMTQMIGRALRGIRAGGGPHKSEANIVLFIDNWKGLINDVWAHYEGSSEDLPPVVRGYRPLEYISIALIDNISRQIDNCLNFSPAKFIEYIPVGWYQTEITVSVRDDDGNKKEEMQSFAEYIMVYNQTRDKFNEFIKHVFDKIPQEWADENLDERSTVIPIIQEWIRQNNYFKLNEDDIGGNLIDHLAKIVRHIAQNGDVPVYHSFEERNLYDLDKLVIQLMNKPPIEQIFALRAEFDKPGNLWKVFYRDFYRFKTAYDSSLNRYLYTLMNGEEFKPPKEEIRQVDLEINEEEKKQIKTRDGMCLCCFKNGRGTILVIDHIVPIFMGGAANVENSQTLCKECNGQKGTNSINFRTNTSPLSNPKNLKLFPPHGRESPVNTLSRTINFFYHCQAVFDINASERSNGSYYSKWEVRLYQGNNPEWLKEHEEDLIKYIQEYLGVKQVRGIDIIGVPA